MAGYRWLRFAAPADLAVTVGCDFLGIGIPKVKARIAEDATEVGLEKRRSESW